MRTKQRKLRFGVVKTIDVSPRARVVASFAAERCTIGATLRHAVVEFALVRILMAAGAGHVCEAERQNLIGPARQTNFVAFRTRNRRVRARERVTRFPVHSDAEGRLMKILDSVTVLATILVRRGSELAVVLIFVAIQASSELQFVDGVFAGW